MTTTTTITPEQLDKTHRIEHNGEIFYLVENSRGDVDDEGNVIEYRVSYDKAHKCLTCTCPAGNPPSDEHGYLKYSPRTCWHLRVVIAHVQSLRQENKARAQIDLYVQQGFDLETSMRVAYAKPTEYSEAQV